MNVSETSAVFCALWVWSARTCLTKHSSWSLKLSGAGKCREFSLKLYDPCGRVSSVDPVVASSGRLQFGRRSGYTELWCSVHQCLQMDSYLCLQSASPESLCGEESSEGLQVWIDPGCEVTYEFFKLIWEQRGPVTVAEAPLRLHEEEGGQHFSSIFLEVPAEWNVSCWFRGMNHSCFSRLLLLGELNSIGHYK